MVTHTFGFCLFFYCCTWLKFHESVEFTGYLHRNMFICMCVCARVWVRVGWDRTTVAQSSKGLHSHMVEWRTVPQWLRWNNFKNGGLKANRRGIEEAAGMGDTFKPEQAKYHRSGDLIPQQHSGNQDHGASLYFLSWGRLTEDFQLHSPAAGWSSTSHIICEAQFKIKMQVSSFYTD